MNPRVWIRAHEISHISIVVTTCVITGIIAIIISTSFNEYEPKGSQPAKVIIKQPEIVHTYDMHEPNEEDQPKQKLNWINDLTLPDIDDTVDDKESQQREIKSKIESDNVEQSQRDKIKLKIESDNIELSRREETKPKIKYENLELSPEEANEPKIENDKHIPSHKYRLKDESPMKYNCTTDECLIAFNELIDYRNVSVEPCDNFYEYACGQYPFIHQYDDDVFQDNMVIMKYFTKEITDDSPLYERKLLKYFNLCSNEKAVNKNSRNELLTILKEIEIWPIFTSKDVWNNTTFVWSDTLIKLKNRGFSYQYFFDILFEQNFHDSNKLTICFDTPFLGIAGSILQNGEDSSIVRKYKQLIVDVFRILKVPISLSDVQQILDLEIAIAKSITLPKSDKNYDKYVNMTIDQVQERFPFVDWLSFINAFLEPEIKVNSSEIVYFADLPYFDTLTVLLTSKNLAPNHVIANFIIWQAIKDFLPYMDKSLRDTVYEYSLLRDNEFDRRDENACTKLIFSHMYIAINSLIVRNYLSDDLVESIQNMADDIQHSFKEVLHEIPWMDERTKSKAIEKIEKMKLEIGFPLEFLLDYELNDYYNDLVVDKTSFLKTVLNFHYFHNQRLIKKFAKQFDRNGWQDACSDALTFETVYNRRNILYMPPTAFHISLFHVGFPNFFNYARLGKIIASEMSRSLDTKNLKFDGNGEWNNWWSNKSLETFTQKMGCFVEQYENFPLETMCFDDECVELFYKANHRVHIDGVKTLDKNMADVVGTKIAYHAYSSWLKRNGGEEIIYLPTSNELNKLTSKQLFWLSYASLMCSPRFTHEELQYYTVYNDYPPYKFRVLGGLMNSPHFARDFNCRPNDPMNTKNKCDLWK